MLCLATIATYEVHRTQAKINLSRLLKEASAGKDVVIVRGQEEVAKLVPVRAMRKKRVPGKLAGQITYSADAF